MILSFNYLKNHFIVRPKIIFLLCSVSLSLVYPNFCQAQDELNTSSLFSSKEILPIKLAFSSKELRKNYKSSTYTSSTMHFKYDNRWDTLLVELKVRGNFRRENCYFPPIKMKIKKARSQGTLFENNKKLKLVLPCLLLKSSNDEIIKEYLAYKLYEPVSPFHFKTRLVDLEFTEIRRKKTKTHHLKVILIEDEKKVAERNDGKVLDRYVHPLAQDPITSTRNALFQFMIGNTDFSTAYQHNQKLLFIDKKIMPLPYDFDMCGLVDASYSVVSNINNNALPISDVTQRLYRGFKRSATITNRVRAEFLKNKQELFNIIDEHKMFFDDSKEYYKTKRYIQEFFFILENDQQFNNKIISKARTK